MTTALPESEVRAVPEPRVSSESLARFRRDRLAVAGAVLLILMVVIAALAPLISPYDPNQAFAVGPYAGVSAAHLLGTDGQGRDVLSRVIWGARPSLAAAMLPVLMALPFGLVIGIVAAQARGFVEELLMRIVDVGLSFPVVLLAVAIAGVVGGGFWTVVIAVAFALTPYLARVSYNVAQTLRSSDFVVAARGTGERPWQILRWELLPNALPAVIVYVTSLLGSVMIVSSGLGFFGLGVAPPTAEWGQMVNDGRVALTTAPLVALAPGAMIAIAAASFSFVGDGVRDVLDPRS
jgi:ABC-type dipeptide/oligopeptide/nickel transport system permease subunit